MPKPSKSWTWGQGSPSGGGGEGGVPDEIILYRNIVDEYNRLSYARAIVSVRCVPWRVGWGAANDPACGYIYIYM